jgi:hypothetical protein
MANFRRLALFTSVSSTGISIYGYEDWRAKELRKLALYSEELSQWGYLKLPSGISVADKTLSWENLLKPKMLKLWKEKHTGFDVEKGQWPEPQNGKNYQLTLRNGRVPGMPLVFSSNYLPQAILCYFVDPEMKLVHFGDQTSFKLKAIISPTWALASLVGLPTSKIPPQGGKREGGGSFTSSFSSFRWGGPPRDMFQFHGDDQSWHITNLPNRKHGKTGKALQWTSHFDAGVENIFTKGLPTGLAMAGCKTDDDGDDVVGKKGGDIRKRVTKIETKTDAERAVLRVALHQLAIVFYCDTPGTLDRASGATGFYPGSHLVVLEGLKRLIHEQKAVSWWSLGYALRQVFGTGESLADEELLRGRSSGGSTSKDWPLVQPILESDQVLLALGTLVHTTMFATELMQPGNNPRVIQNCKVAATFCSTQRKDVGQSEAVERVLAQEAFLDRISKVSPLYQTCVAPLGRAANMSVGSMDAGGGEGGGKGEDTAQRTQSSTVMLFEEYRSHLKKEQSRSKK